MFGFDRAKHYFEFYNLNQTSMFVRIGTFKFYRNEDFGFPYSIFEFLSRQFETKKNGEFSDRKTTLEELVEKLREQAKWDKGYEVDETDLARLA